MPKDPNGATERILASHILRVGGTENSPWISFENGQAKGRDAELIQRFAAQMHARVEWSRGSESVLLRRLEDRKLDMVAGGFTSDSPWSDRLGTSRPYAGEHIVFTAPGENQLLLRLDTFLADQRQAPQP